MKQSAWRQGLIEYIRSNANPPDKFSHQPRLYRLACALAEARPFDDDVLFAAAWMHDLGVFVGHRPEEPKALAAWDHVAYAFKTVPGVLVDLGFPAEKIPAVMEVIRTHLPSTTPSCFEGSLMRDADILEQLGAVAILRTVSKVGRDTRFVRHSDALRSLRRCVDTLPAQLQLESGRRLAEPRVKTLQAFLDAADQEVVGEA